MGCNLKFNGPNPNACVIVISLIYLSCIFIFSTKCEDQKEETNLEPGNNSVQAIMTDLVKDFIEKSYFDRKHQCVRVKRCRELLSVSIAII